jgi:protein gp37
MCDVFEDHPTANDVRPMLWDTIHATPMLDWQLLTKRPENIAGMLPPKWGTGWPNVWLGVSTENQHWFNRRVPELLDVSAAVYFESAEPLLGSIDMMYRRLLDRLHWVIVGGESGSEARPMQLDWARMIRHQCQATGTPFFFKQLGGRTDKHAHDKALLDGVRHTAFPMERPS